MVGPAWMQGDEYECVFRFRGVQSQTFIPEIQVQAIGSGRRRRGLVLGWPGPSRDGFSALTTTASRQRNFITLIKRPPRSRAAPPRPPQDRSILRTGAAGRRRRPRLRRPTAFIRDRFAAAARRAWSRSRRPRHQNSPRPRSRRPPRRSLPKRETERAAPVRSQPFRRAPPNREIAGRNPSATWRSAPRPR